MHSRKKMLQMNKLIDNNKWHYTMVDNSILDNENYDIYQKSLYIALKRFANLHSGQAFPGAKKLSDISGMSERKVRSTLKELADLKLIDIEHRLHQTSIYTILELPAHNASPAPHAGGTAHGARGVLHTVQGEGAHGADELKKLELEKVELEKLKENVDKSTDVLFEEWWNLYDKKSGGDKKRCRTKYKSLLKKNKHEAIMEGSTRYKNHLANLKSRGEFSPTMKNPLTFLNGENFNDEYKITPSKSSNIVKPSNSIDASDMIDEMGW